MKEKKTQWLAWLTMLVLTLSLCLLPASHANAQDVSFTIPKQDIVAEILPDGNVKFTDIQTYDVDFMNGAIFRLDYSGYELEDYRIGVREENGEITYFDESDTGNQGTYSVRNYDAAGSIEFRVYKRASNEDIEFVYEYEIAALITNYADTADLNRKFGTNDYTTDVTVRILLPGLVEQKEDFRAWGYGAPQGDIQLSQEDGRSVVTAVIPDRTSSQFVEVQTIFPLSLTPDNPNVDDRPMKDDIIARSEAQVQADLKQFQKDKQKSRLIIGLAALVPALLATYATRYYFKNRKALNPHPVKLPKHIYELPADITPALMATAYYRSNPSTDDFSATIMDLARKGYLTLEEVAKEKRGLLGGLGGDKTTVLVKRKPSAVSLDKLLYHEKRALDYVLPDGLNQITLEELEQKTKKSTSFQKKQYSKWTQFTQDAHTQGPLISEQPTSTRVTSMFLAIFSLMLPIVIPVILIIFTLSAEVLHWAVLSQMPTLLFAYLGLSAVCFIWGIVLVILNSTKPIRSAKEDEQRQMWDGFKNMLNDIGNFKMREIASLPLWEAYLVYAISLGVADKVTAAMEMEFSKAELDTGHLGGGFYSNPYMMTSMMRQSVSTSVAAAAPKSSGSSGSNSGGFGGGFSGGSSGGSGGGTSSGGF